MGFFFLSEFFFLSVFFLYCILCHYELNTLKRFSPTFFSLGCFYFVAQSFVTRGLNFNDMFENKTNDWTKCVEHTVGTIVIRSQQNVYTDWMRMFSIIILYAVATIFDFIERETVYFASDGIVPSCWQYNGTHFRTWKGATNVDDAFPNTRVWRRLTKSSFRSHCYQIHTAFISTLW